MSNRIREWRLRNGMTQQELGEAIGKNKSAISKLESGRTALTHRMMVLLSNHLHCGVAEIIVGGSDGKEPQILRRKKGQKVTGLREMQAKAQEAVETLKGLFLVKLDAITPKPGFDEMIEIYKLQIKCAEACAPFIWEEKDADQRVAESD